MNDDPSQTASPFSHSRRDLLLRSVAACLVVVAVFAVARLNAGDNAGDEAPLTITTDRAPRRPATTDLTPATPAAPADPYDAPQVGGSDPLDSLGKVMDEMFGTSEEPSVDDNGESPDGQRTYRGAGAAGGTWSVSHPASWAPTEAQPGFTLFASPAYSDIALVVTRPYVGPLSHEAERDLTESVAAMDAELVDIEDAELAGQPAIRARLRYVDSRGDDSMVTVAWVTDGHDSLYVVATDVPATAGADEQAEAEAFMDSFTTVITS